MRNGGTESPSDGDLRRKIYGKCPSQTVLTVGFRMVAAATPDCARFAPCFQEHAPAISIATLLRTVPGIPCLLAKPVSTTANGYFLTNRGVTPSCRSGADTSARRSARPPRWWDPRARPGASGWSRLRCRRPWLVLPPGDPGSRVPAGTSGRPPLLHRPWKMIRREGRKCNARCLEFPTKSERGVKG